ncbi:MAG: hypothetical protein LAT83_13530 [Kiritimatiellae bacterium]|nr:hypothetical protein [Kiritimatiellia bacterium]
MRNLKLPTSRALGKVFLFIAGMVFIVQQLKELWQQASEYLKKCRE